jgi:Transglutaminase-like superfamily
MIRHRTFNLAWILVNSLLVISVLLAVCSLVWEFSTRRYLRGFSDAIVPLSAPAEKKVESILTWMQLGPSRLSGSDSLDYLLRDPATTLNYRELLKTCGTATNAFVNLANSSGLPARRLLLMDGYWSTKHVVVEVQMDDRWVVVDPAYRIIFRDANGRPLTRTQLLNPQIFKQATDKIPGYLPTYSFDRTAQVRFARIPYLTPLVNSISRVRPGWSDSIFWTYFLERESTGALAAAMLLVILVLLIRHSLRWYGEKRIGLRKSRVRQKIAQIFRIVASDPNWKSSHGSDNRLDGPEPVTVPLESISDEDTRQ